MVICWTLFSSGWYEGLYISGNYLVKKEKMMFQERQKLNSGIKSFKVIRIVLEAQRKALVYSFDSNKKKEKLSVLLFDSM